MDPNIQNIILGITGNIFTSFIYFAFGITIKSLKRKNKSNKLEDILKSAIDEIFENEAWDGSSKQSQILLFLKTPEVENIVHQIYTTLFLDESKSIEKIKIEFRLYLDLYVDLTEKESLSTSNLLFKAFQEICNIRLNQAINQGSLLAHEAKSEYRQKITLGWLSKLDEKIELLSNKDEIDLSEILKFEDEYRKKLQTKHGVIRPPFVDRTKLIEIEKIYVTPHLSRINDKNHEESDIYQHIPFGLSDRSLRDYSQFLSQLQYAVILGNPGGGKSTLTHKICYDVSKNYDKRFVSERLFTPILVVLRDYGIQKKDKNYTIVEFIEQMIKPTYQISRVPPNAIEYMLMSGRVFVIFDGLDELLDTRDRQAITDDIELFCVSYPTVPILVTSREVGYEQAPLSNKFVIHKLASFNDEQVKDYVKKWFEGESDSSEPRHLYTESFLRESQTVPDLRSNPLMLALMCNIYKGENYIPKNRPDVYTHCANMLFERWDRHRGIRVELEFEQHIRPAMNYLAYWIYSEESLQTGVSEGKLISKTRDFLLKKRFEEIEEAEQAARRFVEFCKGRAWVFTDAGTTRDGELLFQFSHQTFLEYFTAEYLTSVNRTPKDLIEALKSKIVNREWDVVSQLAVQIQDKRFTAGDELLNMLLKINYGYSKFQFKWNILSFMVRCLEFIVPNSSVVREITYEVITLCLTDDFIKPRKSRSSHDFIPSEIIGYLLNAGYENQKTISKSLQNILCDKINNENNILAAEIALHLQLFLKLLSSTFRNNKRLNLSIQPQQLKYWDEVSDLIYSNTKSSLVNLMPQSIDISIEILKRNDTTLEHIIQLHGLDIIFSESHSQLLPFPTNRSKSDQLLLSVFTPIEAQVEYHKFIPELQSMGQILPQWATPWVKRTTSKGLGFLGFFPYILDEKIQVNIEVFTDQKKPDAFFGIFAIIAVNIEIFFKSKGNVGINDKDFIKLIKNSKTWKKLSLEVLKNLILARYESDSISEIATLLQGYNFSDLQVDVILKWVENKINFVQWA